MLPSSNIRLIWFLTDPKPLDLAALYQTLFVEEPDKLARFKNQTPQTPFLATAGGSFGGYSVELQAQTGRVDLVLQPDAQALGSQPNPAPSLLDTQAAIWELDTAIARAELLPESHRNAVVVVATKLCDSNIEAIDEFNKYVGTKDTIIDSSDHFFQINKRKEIGNVYFNRVVQAAALEFQSFQLSMNGQSSPAQTMNTTHVLNLTFDFNTVPDGTTFGVEKQKEVFRTLLDEQRIACAEVSLEFLNDAR
ncbi:hypothetical protein LZ686_00595 [Paracoccus sp. NFXS7]|uniref:hypothetical protein n=1 Tax=Paracoccus sp. NFXS7 TaxID=2908653 RepID=UPI0032DE94C3